MAKGVQIPIEVVDKFSKQLGDMNARLNTISESAKKQQTAFNLLSADIIVRYGREAAGAVLQFAKDSIRAFEEQETANNRLRVAMQNLGVYSEAAFQKQLRMAEGLQTTTAFADEQIVEMQATLTTFGLYGRTLESVTKATLDFATAQKIDLHSASLLLGKAYAGETSSLSRYGIVIDESIGKSEKFAAVMAQLQKRFSGAASAELETHVGKVKNLSNAFGDLKEKIGADLVKNIDSSLGSLTKFINVVNSNYESIKRFSLVAGNLVGGGMLGPVTALIHAYRGQQEAAEAAYEAGNRAVAGDKAGVPGLPSKEEIAVQLEDEGFALAERARMYIENRTMTNEELSNMEAERMAAELQAEGQLDAAKQVIAARGLERDKVINMERIQATRNMFGMLASLQTAKTKEIAAIGKAAAFATALVNAHMAASQALAAFAAIPPLAIAMAAVMEAAGMAQAMMIAGVPLAEGGIAMPKSGGVSAVLAENGEPEVVAPLWKLKNILGIGEGGVRGGGGVTVAFGDINVTVQASDVGSPADRRSLAEQLADELRRRAAPAIEAAILMQETAKLYPARAA